MKRLRALAKPLCICASISHNLAIHAGWKGTLLISHDERWDLEVLKSAERYQRWILSCFGQALRGKVLEVGGGNGNFTRWIAPQASRVVVLEPDLQLSSQLAELSIPNVETIPLRLEHFSREETFDSVVMINVLEHIEDDTAALSSLKRLLTPEGKVCVLVPAHKALYAPIDSRFGHYRRYSKVELKSRLDHAGFDAEVCRYFNPIGAIGWIISFKLARRSRLGPGAVKLNEAIGVPLGRALERLGAPPFGQSVIAVASMKKN